MSRMPTVWSVGELNHYVRQSLEKDIRLQDLRVTGEVSSLKLYPSGHWYFTLKDAAAQVSCVMWRSRADAQRLRYQPRDGDQVEAVGNITLYEVRGQYQFDVMLLQPVGAGELYREFLALKARLEAEGLFAEERKRPLPRWPATIGLVTSPAGAALRDVLNILRRRLPLARVILSPTPVQGADAPPQIVAALEALARFVPDVILVVRGGGSLEDLWAFNSEAVARAIAASPVPVISGVGHETDFTLADFAADLRAPTPSAAAELASQISVEDLAATVAEQRARLAEALGRLIGVRRGTLAERRARLWGLSPQAQLRGARQHVDDLTARLATALAHMVTLKRERWHGLSQALSGVNPLAVLARGYAVVSHADGRVVRKAQEVVPGEPLHVRVSEGEFDVNAKDEAARPGARPLKSAH
jgi:exodeoxyribonuclease VII large subunit